ncbi:MAG: Ribosomal silencing factor RsfS [Pseudomonadota bacterium]
MSETKPRNTAIQKLQRAIVDGLEDVKGQEIVVFNTEAMSPLFERVIVASGTSNRQTKALAHSVSEAVKDAGFPKPRMEGEDNGEWIIVDCGQAVVHVMQPVIRQYYRLEEIWGGKAVRLKSSAPAAAKPAPPKTSKSTKAVAAESTEGAPKAARTPRITRTARVSDDTAASPRRRTRATSDDAASAPARPPRARRPSAAGSTAAAPRRRTAPIKTLVVNAPDAKKRKSSKTA